jgi:hypothetical protein
MSFLVPVAEPQTAEELYEHYRRVRARLDRPPVRPKKVILALVPPAPTAPVHRTRWYEYEESWARTKAAIHALRNIGGRSHAELIVKLVARETGIPEDLILASDRTVGTRSPNVVKARTEAITRLYTATRWSTPKVGRFFGGRDHTTILHALYKSGAKQRLQGRPPKRLPDETIEAVIKERLQNNISSWVIAEKYDIHPCTVTAILRRHRLFLKVYREQAAQHG